MYSIMVVDDIKHIRQNICRIVQEYFGGKASLFEASDGQEALLMFESVKLDIVITDIRMDHMDGLEFLGRVRENNNEAVFIIISGYNEFEYAQKAIQYRVVRYLLKPINRGELEVALQMAVEAMSQINRQHRLQDENRNQQAAIVRQMLLDYMTTPASKLDGQLKSELKGALPEEFFTVLIVDAFNDRLCNADNAVEIRKSIKGVADTALVRQCRKFLTLYDRDGRLAAIINSREPIEKDLITAVLQHLEYAAETYNVNRIVIGVSNTAEDPAQLPELYGQACHAARQRLVRPDNILFHREVRDLRELSHLPVQIFSWLKEAIELNDKRKVIELADNLFDGKSLSGYSAEGVLKLYRGLSNYLSLEVIDRNDSIKESGEAVRVFNGERFAFDSLQEICISVKRDCFLLCDLLANRRVTDSEDKIQIQAALNYINGNYNRDISMAEVANRLNLSYSHFSRLFGSVAGMGFVEYITKLRMEKAKELARDPALDIRSISEKVGYGSFRHFSRCFREYTGMLPSDYRRKIGVEIRDSE